MKISKLWLDNVNRDLIERLVFKDKIDLSNSCTGKSTGYALTIIGDAMTNPEKPIQIVEHGVYYSDLNLVYIISNFIEKNNLKYFTISESNMTLTYDPFVEAKVKLIVDWE